MPIIATHQDPLDTHQHQIYNGLDCCVTMEVYEALEKLGRTPATYAFSLAMQAPALDIMRRGFLVDGYAKEVEIRKLEARELALNERLQRMSDAIWHRSVNPRSGAQLKDLFHGIMGLPEVWTSKKGVKVQSMDRAALEKLDLYLHARPVIQAILGLRDILKQIQVLKTEIDPDSRYRTSINIAGTETFRFSSSKSSEGTGGNSQNIAPGLRHVFIADPGWKLCGIDLEQAESREVGWIHGVDYNDWTYLDACYAGDLHTITARMVWPERPWTGDLKKDRPIAEETFYRTFSYRDMAKRGGHGTSYMGTPFTMGRHLKVPTSLMEGFQEAFFEAYPAFPVWHSDIATQLAVNRSLTNTFGLTRDFFGRANDPATIREGVAFKPQSQTALRNNLIMYRVWRDLRHDVQLLAVVHDAVYFQYRPAREAEVIPAALALYNIPMKHKSGRELIVPGEAKVGWNWGSASAKNAWGLAKWKATAPDMREPPPGVLLRTL